MPDYNIYIRNVGGNTQQEPTKPWKQEETDNNSQTTAWIENTQQGIQMGMNPTQLLGVGATGLAKAIPAVAVAFAVVKIVEKVVDKAWTFVGDTVARQQGDPSVSHAQKNLKQLYHNLTDPFGMTINIAIEEDNRRIENERRYLQRGLIGESTINRGV